MGILSLIIGPVSKLLDRILPDPKIAEAAKAKIVELQAQGQLTELDGEVKQTLAAAGIVQTEAQSTHWLTSAWRPITMLTFVALIVARLFGLTSSAVGPAEYMELWGLVKLGLGGYVGGRTVEKVAPFIASAIKGK